MNSKCNFYFPGGNTTYGFYNFYNQLSKDNCLKEIFTLKGGPGVGKSTLMKEAAKKFEHKNYTIDYYYCSSDPESLDGVLIKEKGILFVDGTSPHIIDPKYPGAMHTLVNLADFYNKDMLYENKAEIIELTDNISSVFNSAYKYLNAALPVYQNISSVYEKALIKQNFYSLINYITEKVINNKKGKKFTEKKLFLSAITPIGLKNFFKETINSKNIYVLNSTPGDLTHKILEKLKIQLEINEFAVESYYCPIEPAKKLEHLIVPELDLAIITSNKYHKFTKGEIINTSTLYNLTKNDYTFIDYDLNLADILINRATEVLKLAKSYHDDLEEYYKKAMDYKKLNKFSKKLLESIFR